MVAGNIVKRYSELPKTITLTLNHILQLGFCRSLTCKTSKEIGVYIHTYCIYTNGPFRFPVPMIEMVADEIDPTPTGGMGLIFRNA